MSTGIFMENEQRTEKKCPDCGVYYEAGARHFSGCKSHPGEVALTSKQLYTARYPAAFINAIADEGTKAEAVEWLQRTWDELQDLRHDMERAMRNHSADLNADETSGTAETVPIAIKDGLAPLTPFGERIFDLCAELRRYFDSGLLNEATDLHLLLKEIEAQKPPEDPTASKDHDLAKQASPKPYGGCALQAVPSCETYPDCHCGRRDRQLGLSN